MIIDKDLFNSTSDYSHKRILCICDNCGKEKLVVKCDITKTKGLYRYCQKCAVSICASKEKTKEHLDKIKKAITGKPKSLEHRKNISISRTGYIVADEIKKKLSIQRRGVPKLKLRGRVISLETRIKTSIATKGSKHWRWKKDRSFLTENRRDKSTEYVEWRISVYKRDNYKCKIDSKECCGRIEAHHILNWIDFPENRFDINNGITLCQHHHPLGRKKEREMEIYLKELLLVK